MTQREQHKRVFNHFDRDKDGKISASVLQRRVEAIGSKKLTLEEAEEAVKAVDADGDGLLDFEEFVRFVEDGEEKEKEEDLKEAFKMYAMEEGCGSITPRSLKRMLSRLGESRSIQECEVMIAHFDLNGDGVINFDEFRVMMQ